MSPNAGFALAGPESKASAWRRREGPGHPRPVLLGLRARAARGDEPQRLSRGLPQRPGHDRLGGRADDRGDRRAGRGRHLEGLPPRPHLPQPHDQALSDDGRLLRHGGHDPARRQLLPARRAGARGAQADPLPARPGRRRQVVARRAAQGADGDPADLRARGRRRTEPGVRIAARPLPPRGDGRRAREPLRHPAAPPDRHLLALGGQAPRRSSTATSHASPSSSSIRRSCARSASPRPSRATRTTRTSPPWSARSTSASSSISRSTIRTPTATRAASTARRRACSNSSRCSRRRSRCCTRC